MFAMFVTYGSYFAVKALTKPIYGIALTVFYFDQRIRKEGFDIEWMMREAGMLTPPGPKPEAAALSTPQESPAVGEPEVGASAATEGSEPIALHQAALESTPREGNA